MKKPPRYTIFNALVDTLKDLKALSEDRKNYREAETNLQTLEWSVEFLCSVLKRAGRGDVAIRVENNGLVLTLARAEMLFPDSGKAVPATKEERDRAAFEQYMGYNGI